MLPGMEKGIHATLQICYQWLSTVGSGDHREQTVVDWDFAALRVHPAWFL